MAAPDPHQHQGFEPGQPGAVQGDTVPRVQPVQPAEAFPQSQPASGGQLPSSEVQPAATGHQYPTVQPIPQGTPNLQAEKVQPGPPYPQAQPLPQGRPLPQAQPVYQGQGGLQAQSAAAPQPIAPGQAAGSAAARPVLVKGAAASLAVDRRDDEPEGELSTIALKNSPPWLVSAIFHMLLMIILGLVLLPEMAGSQIDLESVWAEQLGDQLEYDSFLAGTAEDEIEEPVYTPLDLPEVPDPFAAPPSVDMLVRDGTTSTSDIPATQIGLALRGREEGMKLPLLARYGGNKFTQEAVEGGLEWLARNQRKDGSWSLIGPYSNGAVNENEVAATAMALLAFQGDNHTHQKGKYKTNVARGWSWLLSEQDADGNFFHEGPFHHRFYTNAQCAIALCELYGMTKDEKFREPAERAIDYLLRSQSSEGGWRYSPQADSDVSVTGWVVMALQSARMAYLAVPEDNLRRVERFLDKVALDGGRRYPYQRGREATAVMTAEALLCRQYLGWRRDDARLVDGVRYLTQPENLIDYGSPNVYYWYYATQVCHHMEGQYWDRWNEVMRQAVPEQQVKNGREAGSWDPLNPRPDAWEDHGGRLYVTCLSIYMLEVYYRHLPIYSKVYTYIQSFD